MAVKPCPLNCKFNWQHFHEMLDVALAHMITDAKIDAAPETYQPTKTPIIKLMEYSDAKRKLEEQQNA